MKKQLQEKLSNYKANLSLATFEPAAVGRFGLASTAALAAMVAAPVELGAQVVCGNLGAPVRTVGTCTGDLAPLLSYNCAFFDFDGDGVNELQVYYYNFSGFGLLANAYVDPIGVSWGRKLKGPYATAYGSSFPGNPIAQSAAYVNQYGYSDKLYAVRLSNIGGDPANDGYGFITFDVDLYNFNDGTHQGNHPVTGQPICCFNYGGVVMWGAQTGITSLNDALLEIQTSAIDECPGPVALPVALSIFEAQANEKSISLRWTTATETANAGFEVERSMDGANFRVLQFVEGQGDATEANQYSFEDQEVVAGNEYLYRLKQINFDGTFQYSEVVSAELLKAGLQASIFPNPVAGGSAQLSVAAPNDEDIMVTVFSGSGQRMSVATESVREGSNRLSLDLSDLVAGIYFLKLEQAGETTYEKFVVE